METAKKTFHKRTKHAQCFLNVVVGGHKLATFERKVFGIKIKFI
jgi:hypothetical protein